MKSFVILLPEKSLQFKRNPKALSFQFKLPFRFLLRRSIPFTRPTICKMLANKFVFLGLFLPGAAGGHSSHCHCTLLSVFCRRQGELKINGRVIVIAAAFIYSLPFRYCYRVGAVAAMITNIHCCQDNCKKWQAKLLYAVYVHFVAAKCWK